MHLEDFATVAAVVRLGTFTAAAAELAVSQPALSRRIARIEREVGGRLFDRLPRRAAPTAAAHALAAAAGHLAAEADGALEEARAVAAGTSGRIRMSSLAGGISLLGRGLVRFQSRRPRVWVELRTLGADDAVVALRDRVVDLATLPGSSIEPGMGARKLARWRAVAAVRPEHPFAARRAVTISQLAAEPLLMLAPEFMVARHVTDMAARTGLRLRTRLADASPEAVLSLARRGWGVGVVPDSVRMPAGLVAVPLAGQGATPEFDYVIAWLRDRTLPAAARALVETLVRETAAFRR